MFSTNPLSHGPLGAYFPEATAVEDANGFEHIQAVKFELSGPAHMELITDGETATLWFVNYDDVEGGGDWLAEYDLTDENFIEDVRRTVDTYK